MTRNTASGISEEEYKERIEKFFDILENYDD